MLSVLGFPPLPPTRNYHHPPTYNMRRKTCKPTVYTPQLPDDNGGICSEDDDYDDPEGLLCRPRRRHDVGESVQGRRLAVAAAVTGRHCILPAEIDLVSWYGRTKMSSHSNLRMVVTLGSGSLSCCIISSLASSIFLASSSSIFLSGEGMGQFRHEIGPETRGRTLAPSVSRN